MVMRGAGDNIRLRTAAAAAAYAGALFAIYFVTGPLRAIRLDPALGAEAGAIVESGLFMPIILFSGTMIPAVFRLTAHHRALLFIGGLALVFFLAADIAVGITFCGLSAGEHLVRFFEPAGWIQGATLVVFALFPWLWWRADRTRSDYPPARSLTRSGPYTRTKPANAHVHAAPAAESNGR
jgi:hypothetical protein